MILGTHTEYPFCPSGGLCSSNPIQSKDKACPANSGYAGITQPKSLEKSEIYEVLASWKPAIPARGCGGGFEVGWPASTKAQRLLRQQSSRFEFLAHAACSG